MILGIHEAGGVAGVRSRSCDVLGDHGTSPDDNVVTYGHRQDGRVASDGYAIADVGRFPKALVATSWATVREQVVNEHHPVCNHAITPDSDQFTDEGMGLNPCAGANRHVFLNFNKWPNERIIANCATIDVDRLNNRDIVTKNDVDNVRLPECWGSHASAPKTAVFGLEPKGHCFPGFNGLVDGVDEL